ncbi:hypothetical protein BsWGS_08659 [Bradybaena similaris]
MASVVASDDFDLDDDGILRDSLSRASLVIDDDGIIQDGDNYMYQHVVQGQWTDSGIGGGEPKSVTSMLQLRKSSLEEDLALADDESINISELEASKEAINFVRQLEKYDVINKSSSLDFLDSRESTLNKPHDYKTDLSIRDDEKETSGHYLDDLSRRQMFPDDYYKQLHDLGVLIDGVDLSRDSINEFDETESHVTSHIDGEGDGNIRGSKDLIGEYLEHELRKEEEEKNEGRKVSGKGSDFRQSSLAYSQASSQDISSFFDEGDNIDNHISENVEGIGNPETQKLVGDNDDTFFYVSGQDFPSQPKEIARGDNLLQPQGSRTESRVYFPVTETKSIISESQAGIPSTGSIHHGNVSNDARYFYSEVFSPGSRPSSRTNHVSVTSEISSARQKNSQKSAPAELARVNSQESFYEENQRAQNKREKPPQRRLLPQPSSSEPSQSFRIKNLHLNKIENKQEPVKPGNESGSQTVAVSRVNYGEEVGQENTKPENMDESTKQLLDRLTQEATKRKQATELFQHLQKDYSNLLTKYAHAELTIDQMRFVRMVTLNADSPTPSQAQSGKMSPAFSQQAPVTSLQKSPSRAVLMTSPAQSVSHAATFTDGIDQSDKGAQPASGNQNSRSRLDLHRGSVVSLLPEGDDVTEKVSEARVETVKSDLLLEAKNMEDRLESFCTLLDGGQLTLENQELMFEQIKSDHDTLRRAYLQVKDEYNVLRRSGALASELQNFDQNKELEGYLFRLGMRFDEVSDTMEDNLKERSKQRRPFQENQTGRHSDNRQGTDSKTDLTDVRRGSGAVTNQQTSTDGNETDVVDSPDNWRLENRVRQLREEYNANMDAYRKLKYSASTPEGVREIEHIVLKLDDICTEMPDMFRLSPEIQARRDQMIRENRLKINDRKNSIWEKLSKREQEVKQNRMSPVTPLLRDSHSNASYHQQDEQSPKILRHGSHSSDQDSLRARLDGGSSRSSLTSILPDRMDRRPSRSNSLTDHQQSHSSADRPTSRASNRGYSSADPDRPLSRSGTPGGDHSFSDSMSRDPDSSHHSFRRPRRHEHGMKDPQLSQMSDFGRRRHLADHAASNEANHSISGGHGQSTQAVDGASDIHDGHNNMEGALAALPGPGKLKQLTKQRAAEDADSGFIGSMVGSGVGLDPAQLQQHRQQGQQQQQQPHQQRQQGQQQQQQQQQNQQRLRLKQRQGFDESSTLTDQSMDTSTQHEDRPHMRTETGRSQEQKRLENQQGHGTKLQKEDSYDEKDISTENSSFEKQSAATSDSRTGLRGKEENDKELYDATMEDSYSAASDVSTPRAINQSHSETVVKKPLESGQPPENKKTPIKFQKDSAGGQTVNETESLLGNPDTSRARRTTSEASLASDREEEITQGRRRSLLSPGRPPSRGSPTTDLHHTRERTLNDRDRQRHYRQAEPTSRKEQEQGQKKGYVRVDQQLPMEEQSRLQHRKHASVASDRPAPDPQHSEITRKVKEYEERSAGSDVEVSSNLTRSSSVASSSNRLRALQEEIERLKEGVARANERANQPPPPAQIYHISGPAPAAAAAQQQPQEPGYYDPFDDPYGFMRMPRRRANSFSGGREREWDEWYWTLPQNRQYDGGDIPLGYAAADAYADLPVSSAQQGTSRDSFKNRLRQRRMTNERQRRDIQPGEPVPEAHDAHLTASQQSHLTANQPQAGPANEQRAAMFEYYLPSRFNAAGMRQQSAPQGHFRTPGKTQIYSSTGEDGDNEEEYDIINSGYQGRTADANNRPWYHIQRGPRTLASNVAHRGAFLQTIGNKLSQSHDNISRLSQAGQHLSQYPSPQVGPTGVVGQKTATQVCPMCGGTGSHTHVGYQPQVGRPSSRPQLPAQYSTPSDSSPVRMSRHQSRSPSHHAVQRSHSHSRYRVREYSHLSDSEEEERITRRNRSLSRGRSRTRYQSRSQSRHHRQQSHSESDQSGDEETGLDYSLSLSVDIASLTKKMLGTVSGELLRIKGKREFGSSFW